MILTCQSIIYIHHYAKVSLIYFFSNSQENEDEKNNRFSPLPWWTMPIFPGLTIYTTCIPSSCTMNDMTVSISTYMAEYTAYDCEYK